MTVFLFSEIDHPALFEERATPETENLLAAQYFLLEEIFHAAGAVWLKRTPRGVLAAYEQGNPVGAALEALIRFQGRPWGSWGRVPLKIAMHAGVAEPWDQDYLGPDVQHTLKVLDAAWGGQILLTPELLESATLPPQASTKDLGSHLLKDLARPKPLFLLRHPSLEAREFPPPKSMAAYANNFSYQSTPFFGREEEARRIEELLLSDGTRLVTLAGPGGFGKTRLAIQTAANLVDRFPQGAFLIPLAPLSSDRFIVEKIASVLQYTFNGVEDPKQQLFGFLKEKSLLLVMDNFEHILEGAQLVGEILAAAPSVKVLVTTRERLKLPHEKVLEIRGLRYPSGADGHWRAYSAVQLFLKSVRKQDPQFKLKPGDEEAVTRVCQILEGMPLGIELASTWIKTLPLSEIAEKIQSNRETVALVMPHLPSRHQSLRAVFEYSWVLLSEEQKQVLRTASVFRGGFSLDAALHIAGAGPAALKQLEDKFLVRHRPHERFELHELLKYYAKEKLFDSPREKEKVQADHCAYFAKLLRRKEKKLQGPSQRRLLQELVEEMDNIRESWAFALDRGLERRLADLLDGFFYVLYTKTWLFEGREIFSRSAESLRQRLPSRGHSKPFLVLLGKVLSRWASFEHQLGDLPKARSLYEESLKILKRSGYAKALGFVYSGQGLEVEALGGYQAARPYYQKALAIYRRQKDKAGQAWAQNNLGHLARRLGDHSQALKYCREALRYYEAVEDPMGLGWSNNLIGDILHELGRYEEARHHYQRGLSVYVESGDRRGVAWSFTNLGRVIEATGDFNGAKQMFREGMALDKEFGDRRALAWVCLLIGQVDWALGDYEEARRYYEDGEKLYRESGDPRGEAWSLDLQGNLAVALREFERADLFYEKSRALLAREGANALNQGWHGYHKGTVDFFQGRYAQAQAWFLKGLGFFKKVQDPLGQVTSLTHLGEVSLELRKWGRAEQYFGEALRMALPIRLLPHVVDLLVALAQLLKAQGDERSALVFLVAALNHPTCRRQTKDRIVQFATRLEARFTTDEVQDAVQQAKTTRVEDLAGAWLTGLSRGSRTKSQRKKRR
ncbi:MAG TPA: tetratricopeptide repeat protein [bacterium]|nr:tetratricopeptide repeat protein [bacterium]